MADDFDFGAFAKSFLTDGKGGMSSFLPALGTAIQQWNNSDQYKENANAAAQDASPVSTTDRRYYIDRLNQSYKDPNFMLNDPGHTIQRQRGLDAVASNDAAKGYMGSGNMLVDLSKFASESDQTFLDQERERMMKAGGFQFDPANAAAIRVKGDENAMNSRNAALAAMFTQFNQGKGGPPGGGGSPDGLTTLVKPGVDVITAITNGSKGVIDKLISAGTQFVKMPDGSTVDLHGMARSGYRTGEEGDGMAYPTPPGQIRYGTGGTDQPDYGYGPGENPDSYTSPINWDQPDAINWDTVNYDNFTPSDWDNLGSFFGLTADE